MTRHEAPRPSLVLIVVLTALVVPIQAQSGTSYFTDGDASDSFWTSLGNWDSSVPDAQTDAYIGDGKTAEHNAGDAEAKLLTIGHGGATLPGNGTLNITGGTLTAEASISVARHVGYTGILDLSGSGTTLSAKAGMNIGHVGTGTFNMSDNATYTSAGTTMVGSSNDSSGTWTLSGPATSAALTNHVWIGDHGSASLTVQNGATLQNTGSSSYIVFGQRGNENQTISALITGQDSLLRCNVTNHARGIILGGNIDFGTLHRTAGTVHVTVADQGRMESNRMVVVYGPHTLKIDNGTVTAGTHLWADDQSKFDFVLYNADRDALIQAGGNVEIGDDVELMLSLGTGASFTVGQFVELIQYGDVLDGTFMNYAENDKFALGTSQFRFTYGGGDYGDTIGLHVVPEPGAMTLILLGLAAIALRRRGFRRREPGLFM